MIDNNPLQTEDTAKKQGFFKNLFSTKNQGLQDNMAQTPKEQEINVDDINQNVEDDDTDPEVAEKLREKAEETRRQAEIRAKNDKITKIAIASVVGLVVIGGAGGLILLKNKNQEPQQMVEVVGEQDVNASSDGQAGQDPNAVPDPNLQEMHEVATQEPLIGLDPIAAISVRDSMPTEHWAKSIDPVNTLSKKATEEGARALPEYNQDIQGFHITDKIVYGGMGAPYAQLVSDVQKELELRLGQRIRIEQHQNQKIPAIISTPEERSMGAPEIRAIASANEYAQIETEARQQAMEIFNQRFAAIKASLPPEPQPEVIQQPLPAPVDTGISDAQRREFNRLQERSNALISELQAQNKQLLDEIAKKDKQMIEVLQKLEDSPKAQMRLQAHMLESKTNLKVQAIQGDLIFLADKNDKIHTLRVGEALPEQKNLVISNVDANTGIVYVTER